eukprot:scaffold48505_cov24-Prasinocladus_malaysianus.AAC.1
MCDTDMLHLTVADEALQLLVLGVAQQEGHPDKKVDDHLLHGRVGLVLLVRVSRPPSGGRGAPLACRRCWRRRRRAGRRRVGGAEHLHCLGQIV